MFSESAELYDLIYGSFKDYAAEAEQVATLLRRLHPGCCTVLDAGCGTGEHARRLVMDHGFRVDGLDLDDRLLDIARLKHPEGTFWQADMSAFELSDRYDAVLCLFSAIGYLRTLDRVEQALRCFRRHLRADGVIVVEPWFVPGVLDPARITRQTAERGRLRVERVSHVDIDGRISRLHFDYRIEDASGVRTATEVHELGLFSVAEMLDAFEHVGLAVDHDPQGLTGRGLYVGRIAA